MTKLLVYGAGIVTGLLLAGALYSLQVGRDPIYVVSEDLSIQFDQTKGVACTVPLGTRLTHVWSASEGFDQFCLALNIDGSDRTVVSRTEAVGTSPYWLVTREQDP